MAIAGRFARRYVVLAFVSAVIVIAPSTAAGASCGPGTGDAAIVGEVTHLDDSTATFRVEASSPGEYRSAGAPLPAIGDSLPVVFGDDAQFLRVGQRYKVALWWSDGRFSSGVNTAEDLCRINTLHADGSSIETSLISRSGVKLILIATLVTPVLILVLLAFGLRHRHHRRRRIDEVASAGVEP